MSKSKIIAAAVAIALPIVAHFEGESLVSYWDRFGKVHTICYGHTATAKPRQVKTHEECTALLLREAESYAHEVDRVVTVEVHPNTLAALVSFSYNLGVPTLRRSTVLRKINAGDIRGGCNFMTRYVFAGGVKLKGLVKRREAERDLCLDF